MRCAPTVVGGVCERGAFDGLAAARAFHRSGVDQQQLILKARTLAGKDLDQPLDRVRQAASALEVARLRRQLGKQVAKAFAGDRQETTVAGDPHDRLRHTKRDDLRVCDQTTRVSWRFRQEIVRRAINGDAESVEVGVHRGLLVDEVISTADFGLSAKNPSNTATAVESII